ncbi:MAG TPA: hypothetical protein VFL14_12420 [Xanthomonadales bacterium]|nr:hypothetical protein [Xanthomonadales bacterium]
MNDEREDFDSERDGAEEVLDAMRRASRVDFALRIAQSLQGGGIGPKPLAIAFQETVTRIPTGDEAQPTGDGT